MSRRAWIAGCLGVAVALIAVAIWRLRSRPQRPPPDPEHPVTAIDPAAAQSSVERLNVDVAHLENAQLQDAVADLVELSAELPQEVAPVRDLMVARLLLLAGGDAAEADRAQATLEQLQRLDPDSLATRVLAARLAAHQGDPGRAVELLRAAASAAPADLATWFEQYTVAQNAEAGPILQQGQAALKMAFELAPTNLVVLLELLQVQAAAEDPAIVQTFEVGDPRWRQLSAAIQQRVRVNLLDLVSAAREAAQAANWPLVKRNVLLIRNVVTPEEATRSDRRLVERHPLELVLQEFSEPVMQAARDSTGTGGGEPIVLTTRQMSPGLPAGTVADVMTADFDLDTQLEIACLGGGRLKVFRRDDDRWIPILEVEVSQAATTLVAMELDDDVAVDPQPAGEPTNGHPRCHRADLDFVVAGPAGVSAFQNVQEGTQRRLAAIELPPELSGLSNVTRVIPADLDMDGDLDLITLADSGIGMWTNRGDLTFDSESLQMTGVPQPSAFTSALPLDWDDDLDLDLVVGEQNGRVGLLENLRHGEFQWRELLSDVGMPVAAIEPLDRDGAWDLLLGGDAGVQRVRSSVPVGGRVEITGAAPLLDLPVRELRLADLNNDGPLDLIGRTAGGLWILPGRADGFEIADLQSVPAGSLPEPLASIDVTDLNRDGRLDVVVGGARGVALLENGSQEASGWNDVSLLAEQVKGGGGGGGGELSASGRVNHYGIGSVVEIRSGARRQRQILRWPVVHFGLGASRADAVRVLWTNGVPENVIQPESRIFICERQTLKGSCPYLYGWNGIEFAFITDLLWSSPIGLIGPDGKVVPDRPWEYLKIDGRRLQQRDGRYEFRLTEELWEAAYFDSVKLFAVDHPSAVDFFTNEKVGPPQIAEHQLHPVRRRRVPVSAVDQDGRDVLPEIREADERYVKLFDRKLKQGYTPTTTLELDLGDLAGSERIMLFLTGWIYPTDTTINVALSQNRSLDGPTPLSLAVPAADGEWETVIPYTGFPGGKTKTIAIDLTGVFLADDFRVRLSTSLELYWDAVFFTVDEASLEARETELTLVQADLRERGVSAPIPHPHNGPETYDYSRVSENPWRAMQGAFTRLGDVRDLLRSDDDRLLVMASGDEVVLEFASPNEPPSGWTRDFVLRNVGWDKDADLQTVYGQTAEPLPYRGMPRYPPSIGDGSPDTPTYREYLHEMQSRHALPRRRDR